MEPFIAELIGTAILLLLGDGVVANVVLNKTLGQNAGWIVITWGRGMAVFVVGPFSGAHINPAVTIGLVVLVIGLALGGTTGYAINPARDLSPRLVHQLLPIPGKRDSNWGYAWIPVVAPFLGGVLAALLSMIVGAA